MMKVTSLRPYRNENTPEESLEAFGHVDNAILFNVKVELALSDEVHPELASLLISFLEAEVCSLPETGYEKEFLKILETPILHFGIGQGDCVIFVVNETDIELGFPDSFEIPSPQRIRNGRESLLECVQTCLAYKQNLTHVLHSYDFIPDEHMLPCYPEQNLSNGTLER